MVVYADILFMTNFISAYIMLRLLGKFIVRTKIRTLRLLAAAAAGAVGATILFCVRVSFFAGLFFRLILSAVMSYLAFFDQKRHICSQIAWLFTLSAMMVAAMIMLASLAENSVGMITKNGIVYIDIPQRLFALLFALSYAAVSLFLFLTERRRKKRIYSVQISLGDKTVSVPALFDSGNLLKEPLTGRCVSILEWSEAKKLFNADYEFADMELHAEEMKLWAVPFRSVGRHSGIIFAFVADSVEITEEKRVAEKTFIGIYGDRLSKKNEYKALLNAELL